MASFFWGCLGVAGRGAGGAAAGGFFVLFFSPRGAGVAAFFFSRSLRVRAAFFRAVPRRVRAPAGGVLRFDFRLRPAAAACARFFVARVLLGRRIGGFGARFCGRRWCARLARRGRCAGFRFRCLGCFFLVYPG